jgi:hypothetical protein
MIKYYGYGEEYPDLDAAKKKVNVRSMLYSLYCKRFGNTTGNTDWDYLDDGNIIDLFREWNGEKYTVGESSYWPIDAYECDDDGENFQAVMRIGYYKI